MSSPAEAEEPAELTPGTLRIYLLGTPSVEWAGQSFSIFRRQARALLYHLAAHLEPIPRDSLCYLFWPDTPDATAHRNLTRLLTHLRRELPVPELLLTSRDEIKLDNQRVWSDVSIFERLCAAREPYRRVEALHQAVELYRGPFLAGFSLSDAPEFETWTVTKRQSCERLLLEALATLIEDQTAKGAYAAAIGFAQRYLATDDLAEEVHRHLIELYAAAGDRRAALRQFEQCVEVLEQELGVDPLPETRTVYEAALAGRLQPIAVPVPEPVWATLPGLDLPLVGRDEALRRLEEAYLRAQTCQGGIVLVSGEAGIGKSRLVQHFARCLPGPASVLSGGSYPEAQTMPYQPLVEALRAQLNLQPPTWTVQPIWLAEATRLLPELHTLYPDLPPTPEAEPDEARARLFEALSQLILGLAEGTSPLLLILDDLHWADGHTLDWLAYVGRRLRDSRLLVVGTYRSEEAGAVSQLRHSLTRLGIVSEIELPALDVAAVLQLLGHLDVNVSGEAAVAGWLRQITGGNPFFLIETLRALVEGGQPLDSQHLAGLDDLPLSDAAREAIEMRLERLSSKGRQVLEAGAILGQTFGFDLLYQTAGRSDMETMDGLDELVGRQLLLEGAGRYQFHHDLMRTAVDRALSHGRRRLLHRRAGGALEKLRPDVVAALTRSFEQRKAHLRAARYPEAGRTVEIAVRLAHHFSQAGVSEKAIDYLLLAGDRTRGLYANREAIGHYQQALALLKEQEDYERAARTSMKLGLTYHNAFEFRPARRSYEEGFSLWEQAKRTPRPVSLPQAPHPLRIDQVLPPTTVDPAMAVDHYSGRVIDQLFSGLVELRPGLDVLPDVASSWEIMAGGRKYVFHLRQDVYWSDGTPVTAGDFEYAWKRLLNPATGSPLASMLFDIKGARDFHRGQMPDPDYVGVWAPDEVTLVVELEEPISYFLYLMAHYVAYPVPQQAVETHGQTWAEEGKIVSNGPFLLEAWQHGELMVLVRNPAYHGQFGGNVQRVELTLLADPCAKLAMYEADELDILTLFYPPSPEMDRARQRHFGEYISVPSLSTDFLAFDVSRPPFDDRRVRRAFVLAIDRETLAHVVMRGYTFPATGGFIPPAIPGHSPGIGLSYDPEQARRLLIAAGYPRDKGPGFPVVDWVTPSSFEPISEYLQAQWRENLGVAITWETITWERYLARMDKDPPQLFLASWTADLPDPDNFLREGAHFIGWQDHAYDRLIDEGRHVADQGERIKLYAQADRILVEEAAITPLTYARTHQLVKPWITKLPIAVTQHEWFFKDIIIEPH